MGSGATGGGRLDDHGMFGVGRGTASRGTGRLRLGRRHRQQPQADAGSHHVSIKNFQNLPDLNYFMERKLLTRIQVNV